ncbi:MAG: peptidylprolyl isomerase [Catalinimonas sp.]
MKYVLTALLITAAMAGCKTNDSGKARNEPTLITLGTVQVPTREFLYVYQKNNVGTDADMVDIYSEENLREYLDLYVNFKLKVLDAERRGLDTTAAFRQELAGYRDQLAQPYLTEKSVTEQLVQEAYQRLAQEVNASHILIKVGPDADPADTLAAYQKIQNLRQQALGGRDFATLAKQHSEDPSVARNSGNLGWFTALQMVYPFENAAYLTPVGDISQPLRTRFGYHILEVHERRPSQGKVKVAHLMVRANPGMPAEDSLAAKRKIDELYRRLEAGEPWEPLVQQFSEDQSSSSRGGVLPAFGTGNMIPSFEEAAFALNAPGDLSNPTQTPYGWHIIRLEEKYPLEPFEQMEPGIRAKVNKDSRSELNQTALINRLKRENRFDEDENNLAAALTAVDTTLLKGTWAYARSDDKLDDVLFTAGDTTLTRRNFYDYLEEKQQPRDNQSADFVARRVYDEFVNETLIAYEKGHLAEKYEDYRMLVQEYRDGILLFQLMDEEVWSKALEDSTGLSNYFERNREAYRWEERAAATIYNTASAATRDEVKEKLAGKIFPVNKPNFPALEFPRKQITLSDPVEQQLNVMANQIKKDTTLYVDVIGHRERGERASTSRERAAAVKDYLVEQGVRPLRLIAKDFGIRPPVNMPETDHNRGVSFQVYGSSNRALERVMNAQRSLTLQVTEGLFERGEQPILDEVPWRPDTYEVTRDDRYYLIKIDRVETPRTKTLDEARGLAISKYQSYLEEQWIEQLRAEIPVVINETEVQKLIRE